MPCVRQTTPIADNHIHRVVLLLLYWRHSLLQLLLLALAFSRGYLCAVGKKRSTLLFCVGQFKFFGSHTESCTVIHFFRGGLDH